MHKLNLAHYGLFSFLKPKKLGLSLINTKANFSGRKVLPLGFPFQTFSNVNKRLIFGRGPFRPQSCLSNQGHRNRVDKTLNIDTGLLKRAKTPNYANFYVPERFSMFLPHPRLLKNCFKFNNTKIPKTQPFLVCRSFEPDLEPVFDDSLLDLPRTRFDLSSKNIVRYLGTDQYTNLVPNRLDSRFLVTSPNTVWCIDVCKLKTKVQRAGWKYLNLFAAMDLATGKIVAWFVKVDVTAMDIVKCLTPHLAAIRASHLSYGEHNYLLIHSDRGTQFTSDQFTNMQRLFSDFVVLSMSRSGLPTDNSPIERLFRTIVRNPTFWKKVTSYLNEPESVENVQDYVDLFSKIVNYYNSRWSSDRSLEISPEQAETAYKTAKVIGIQPPDTLIANNQAKYDAEFKEVQEYRVTVKECFHQIWMDVAKNASQLERNQNVQAQVFLINQAEQIIQAQSQQQEQITQLTNLVQNMTEKSKQKKNKQKKPQIQRDPFQPAYLNYLSEFMQHNKLMNVAASRNWVSLVILMGTGVRCSDVYQITHGQIKQLIETGQITMLNVKVKRMHTSAIYPAALEELIFAYKNHCALLEHLGKPPTDSDFLNRVFGDEPSEAKFNLINSQSFNRSLNDSLKKFSKLLSEKLNRNVTLKTHSGRIGIVTGLIQKGVNIDTVRKIVGHQQIQTTQQYDKSYISFEKRQELLGLLNDTDQEKKDF